MASEQIPPRPAAQNEEREEGELDPSQVNALVFSKFYKFTFN